MVRYKYRKPHRIKRKRSIFRNRFFWITLLILFFSGAIFYFIVFSSLFQIKETKIVGNEKIQTKDIENFIGEKINQRLLFFPARNIFLINLKEIVSAFLEKFPQAEQINLKRKLPATLIAEIQERLAVGVWCQNEKCFFIDKTGVIFEEGPQDHELVIRFQDKKESFSFGQQIIKESQLLSILEIKEKLKTNLKITPKEFFIPNDERINVKTIDGWEIYFDVRSNIDWQLTKLTLVLEKEIPPEKRGNLEYIDLRFGNLAPYKYRTSAQPTIEEAP